MARRRRKDENPAPAAAPPRADPAPRVREPSRGTFAVARANRVLAETLPDLVFSKETSRERSRTGPRVVSTPPLAASVPSKDSAPKKAKPAPPARKQALTLDRLPAACKPRPETAKGDGGSRAFVPWCKK